MKQSRSWDLDDLVLIQVLFADYCFPPSWMLHLILRENLYNTGLLCEIVNKVALGISNRFQ